MGLIDRAFGADKNSMLAHTLAMHWQFVSSHYENHIKDNELTEERKKLLQEIIENAKGLAKASESSIKGFGVVNFDFQTFNPYMSRLRELYSRIDFKTEKPHWLPQALTATESIIVGNKKLYLKTNIWFTEN
jgi:hypothetical protein